jgi:alpha-L-arabinofuranosidase
VLILGGSGNTKSSLVLMVDGERKTLWESKDLTIDTNRWYEVAVEAKGQEIKCSLDGKLLTTGVQDGAAPLEPLYVSATRDQKANEVILKVVNVGDVPLTTKIQLNGVTKLRPLAKVLTLTGADRQAQNTVEQPEKLKPVESSLKVAGPEFSNTFPPRSISVLRLGAP